MKTTHDQPGGTDALFIGGPWDNQNTWLQGHPPVVYVQTPTKTHNPTSGSIGHYDFKTIVHEYWRIPGEGNQHLYLYVKDGGLPKRLAYRFATRNLDAIGTIVHEAIFQVLGQGGDERTVTARTTIGGTGSAITYTVTAEAFRVPAYSEGEK